jgi:SWIM zinc finger
MHIYRLAIELDRIEPKYLDHRDRFALAGALSREETQRLQRLPVDLTQWGRWAAEVHSFGVQHNRQYRAYSIIYDEREAVLEVEGRWTVHEYSVILDTCECMDFRERRLPCKHIYAAALASKIALPLTCRYGFRTSGVRSMRR